MTGYLERNVTQKARAFLAALQAAPPPTASSRETIALLTEAVRARRDDPEARRLLQGLLDDLANQDQARLPTPQAETRDAAALADELAWLTADRPTISLAAKPRRGASLLAAALLLGGLAFAAGCAEEDNSYKNECPSDISDDHFADLIEGNPGLTDEEIAAAEAGYSDYPKPAKHDMMNRLCSMKAEQIATYIKAAFDQGDDDNDDDSSSTNQTDDDSLPPADDDAAPPADDDTSIDDDAAAYKGVTF